MVRKRRKPRAVMYSFLVTVAVLGGLTAGLYLTSTQVRVLHLPQTVPTYQDVWGRYVPSDVLLFGFENYTMVRSLNVSFPTFDKVLDLVTPRVSLNSKDVSSFLTIVFQTPNQTLDIAFVKHDAFSTIATLLAASGSETRVGINSLFYVANRAPQGIEFGWLAVLRGDDAIAYAKGTANAKLVIEQSLGVSNGSSISVLTRTDLRQMLYTVDGPSGHLAIGWQNFPGAVRTGEMTLTVVDRVEQSVRTNFVVKFSDPSMAISQYGVVRSTYLSATQFTVYDSYVQVVESNTLKQLVAQVRLVE